MSNIYRTHNCNELRSKDIGQEVRLAGSKNKKSWKNDFYRFKR